MTFSWFIRLRLMDVFFQTLVGGLTTAAENVRNTARSKTLFILRTSWDEWRCKDGDLLCQSSMKVNENALVWRLLYGHRSLRCTYNHQAFSPSFVPQRPKLRSFL